MSSSVKKTKIRQRGLFMLYNLAAFTLIFALFAFIIYSQIAQSLFSPVYDDMRATRRMIEGNAGFVEDQISFRFEQMEAEDSAPPPKENATGAEKAPAPPSPEKEEPHGPDWEGEKFPLPDSGPRDGEMSRSNRVRFSMRFQPVLRDGEGNVVNPHSLGRIYVENVVDQIPFSTSQLDVISIFHMEDGSTFHSLAFSLPGEAGGVYYVQLVANMDGEQAIIDNFVRILVVCVAVFVLLSIAASYQLSRLSMKPLLKSWDRQTEFVANASHELRTPLTIIQNKLESLLVAPGDTVLDRAEDIAVSLAETRRLSKLTSDLMTLARADSNATQLQRESFDLDGLIRSITQPYGEMAELDGKVLSLELGYQGALNADKNRIHELMVILLDNALKYTRPGDRVVVRTFSKEGRAVIEVADTGIGISEESRERIFDRFYREQKARSRQDGGSGLGLSIARWIMDAHGGSIRALPNAPAGTVFQVRFAP